MLVGREEGMKESHSYLIVERKKEDCHGWPNDGKRIKQERNSKKWSWLKWWWEEKNARNTVKNVVMAEMMEQRGDIKKETEDIYGWCNEWKKNSHGWDDDGKRIVRERKRSYSWLI